MREGFAIDETTDWTEIVETAAGQGLERMTVIFDDVGVWHGGDLRGSGVREPGLGPPGLARPSRARLRAAAAWPQSSKGLCPAGRTAAVKGSAKVIVVVEQLIFHVAKPRIASCAQRRWMLEAVE